MNKPNWFLSPLPLAMIPIFPTPNTTPTCKKFACVKGNSACIKSGVKILLEFGGTDKSPTLERIAIWDHDSEDPKLPADREVIAEAAADPHAKCQLFRWTSSVRAFCLLMLRASTAKTPHLVGLEGGKRSAARALAELVRLTSKDGERNWLQFLFDKNQKDRAKSFRIPPDIIRPKCNSKKNIFKVHLGGAWQDASVLIRKGGKDRLNEAEVERITNYLSATFEDPELHLESRLTATINILVCRPNAPQLVPISTVSLPVPIDSGVACRIVFSRPAFPFVVWISSTGKVQPLYPWEDFSWNRLRKAKALSELDLPDLCSDGVSAYYPLRSRPGVETAIVMANDVPLGKEPLKAFQRLGNLASKFYPQNLPEPGVAYSIVDPRPSRLGASVSRLGHPVAAPHPMGKFVKKLMHEVGGCCECVVGISFTTC